MCSSDLLDCFDHPKVSTPKMEVKNVVAMVIAKRLSGGRVPWLQTMDSKHLQYTLVS